MKRKFLSLLLVLALALTLLPAPALAFTQLQALIVHDGFPVMNVVAAPGASRTLKAYVFNSGAHNLSAATGRAFRWQSTQDFNEVAFQPINWQDVPGATSQALAVPAPTAGTITFYRVIIDGENSAWCALAGSNTRVTGATEPMDQIVEEGETATFNAAFNATPNADNLLVTWYVSRDGGISYDEVGQGESYTAAPVTLSNNGYRYFYEITEEFRGFSMYHYLSAADARLTVVRPGQEQPAGPIPPTGDSATPYLLGGLAALLLLGLGISLTVRRRQNG